ncbi:element excision factor XisI family protein [Anabaena sphaerica]|uniref:element excision factor XisI family protein n=1 Tax=Anabaena sphaerica TaxID=212446 RepID=UPI003BB1E355
MAVEEDRRIVPNLILEKAQRRFSPEEVEAQAVIDTQNDHYILLHTGWRGNNRTHGCSIVKLRPIYTLISKTAKSGYSMMAQK